MSQLNPQDWFPVLVQFHIAAAVAAGLIAAGVFLGKRVKNKIKDTPYECGITPTGNARDRFSVKFYLVAMLFILFDIEVVFLWSWLTVFKNPGMGSPEADLAFQWFSFAAVMIYMVLWIIGDAYVLRVNAIDWDEAPEIHEAKFGSPQREAAPSTMPDAALQPAGGGK